MKPQNRNFNHSNLITPKSNAQQKPHDIEKLFPKLSPPSTFTLPQIVPHKTYPNISTEIFALLVTVAQPNINCMKCINISHFLHVLQDYTPDHYLSLLYAPPYYS